MTPAKVCLSVLLVACGNSAENSENTLPASVPSVVDMPGAAGQPVAPPQPSNETATPPMPVEPMAQMTEPLTPLPEDSCRESWLFCEDFESTSSGEIPQGFELIVERTEGAARLDTAEHVSGKQSVRLDIGPGNYSFVLLKKRVAELFQPFSGHAFARMRLLLNGLPPLMRPNQAPHWAFLQITPEIAEHSRELFVSASQGQGESSLFVLQLGWEGNRLIRDCGARPAQPLGLSPQRWMCIEYELHEQGVRLWVDDQLVVSAGAQDDTPTWGGCDWFVGDVTGISDVQFGFRLSAGETAVDYQLWMDDLVIDDERIGCD